MARPTPDFLRQSSFARIPRTLHKVPVALEQRTGETKRNQNETKLSKKKQKNKQKPLAAA